MPFIHDRPERSATEATERGKRNYPPAGAVALEGVAHPSEETHVLYCTCSEECPAPCPGETACPGHCEACHYLRLVAEEDGQIEGAGKVRN